MNKKTKSLYDAISYSNTEDVRRLLSLRTIDVNARAWDTGYTPLIWAVQFNRLDVIKLLLEKGADPDLCDAQGNTPLHQACRYADGSRATIALFLLDAGAAAGARRHDGKTPLEVALELHEGNEARERIIDWYREHRPEFFFESYCTRSPGGI